MRGDNARRIRGMVERRGLELLVADAELQVGARGRETGRPAARGRGTTSTHVGVGASSGGGFDQGGGDNSGVQAVFLVDSGATTEFVDEEFVRRAMVRKEG